ncbi:MAG: hypothetical protein OXU20_19365 [Myxococcales bacterium]|nr:hypothetical protein [Myxococcales bacterium]
MALLAIAGGCASDGVGDPDAPDAGLIADGTAEPSGDPSADPGSDSEAASMSSSGAEADGSEVNGSEVNGSEVNGSDAEGDVDGSDAEGSDAEGSDAEGSDAEGPETDPSLPTDIAPEDSVDDAGRIVPECHGLPLVGMKYSPGGTTLPNKCAPFDVRNNNPYAVRCIDAMPDFETPFPGDEYCILPPPPELGFQLGVHPGGNVDYWDKMWAGDYSFYEDTSLTEDYILDPGEDTLQNYLVDFRGPTEERYFYRRNFRGRYGSHHGAAAFTGSPVTEGWQSNGDRVLGTSLLTVQNAYTDIPQNTLEISPEEEGIGISLPLNSGLNMNLHHFNSTDAPLLRENWVNAWYLPKEEVTRRAQGILIAAPVNYPIGMETDSEGFAVARTETQVLSLWGHRHAWTTRFHAWVVRTDGSEELVYDSNDWYDMPTYSYNSVAKNPEPGKGFDGASSGPLILQPGDEMHFNCHASTTRERAEELGVPLPTAPITWANHATAGEMCLLDGQTTGGRLFGGIEHIVID